MKTYVLMVAKKFPVKHPRAGEPTEFRRKMLCGALTEQAKITTIRGNYDRWKMIVDEVNAGIAVLSVRQWNGRPYASKQKEFLTVRKLGIQRIKTWVEGRESRQMIVDATRLSHLSIYEVIKNDGLSFGDFQDWFGRREFNGCILHFSRLRYPVAGWFMYDGTRYEYSKEEVQAAEEFQEQQRCEQGL